jgi:hypothetical protein
MWWNNVTLAATCMYLLSKRVKRAKKPCRIIEFVTANRNFHNETSVLRKEQKDISDSTRNELYQILNHLSHTFNLALLFRLKDFVNAMGFVLSCFCL